MRGKYGSFLIDLSCFLLLFVRLAYKNNTNGELKDSVKIAEITGRVVLKFERSSFSIEKGIPARRLEQVCRAIGIMVHYFS